MRRPRPSAAGRSARAFVFATAGEQTPRVARERVRGAGLLEIVFAISLLGIVLAVAIPTFVRTVRTSKLEEAGRELKAIEHALASYYVGPKASQPRRCLPEAAGPAPAEPSVEPVDVDFHDPATPGAATWRAIGYRPASPLRYRYTLIPTVAGCQTQQPSARATVPLVVLRAEGDLDGDGSLSRLELALVEEAGTLVARGALRAQDRVE